MRVVKILRSIVSFQVISWYGDTVEIFRGMWVKIFEVSFVLVRFKGHFFVNLILLGEC